MEKSERKIVLVLVFLTIIMGALVVFFCAKADSYRKNYDDALKKAKDFVVARYEPGAETDRIQVLGGSLGYDYKILSSEGEVLKDVYVDNSEFEEHVNAAIRAEDESRRYFTPKNTTPASLRRDFSMLKHCLACKLINIKRIDKMRVMCYNHKIVYCYFHEGRGQK